MDYVAFCSWLTPVRSLAKLLNKSAKKVHALARERKKDHGEAKEQLFIRLCQEHGSDAHLNQSQLAAMLLKEVELELTPAEARALRCHYAPLRPVDVFDQDSWVNLINDGQLLVCFYLLILYENISRSRQQGQQQVRSFVLEKKKKARDSSPSLQKKKKKKKNAPLCCLLI